MKLLTIILVTALTMLTAQARIGETLAECIKRYGKPLNVKSDVKDQYAFDTGKIIIAAKFNNGKCNYLFYQKVETDAVGRSTDFSENEISIILNANSKDGEWKLTDEDHTGKLWVNEKSDMFGHYNAEDRILSVCNSEGMRIAEEEKNAGEKADLKGL